MMKKLVSITAMALAMNCLMAQTTSPEVIASSGGYFEGTSASISWTLGELATETYTTDGITLTQGFQQPITVSVSGINVDVLVFLEGPFAETQMNTTLNSSATLPLVQPYNVAPWNYSGTESVLAIPNPDVVDWVLIELRDAPDAVSANSATRIARQAAFLLKDGRVVGIDGSTNLQFSNTLSQQLFVVVWHRNHLGVLSANALSQTSGTYSYDFSVALTQAYNADFGYKAIGGGIYGMAGGDNDADGDIDLTDIAAWKSNAGTTGYKSADFNMNSQVNNTDKNDVWIENNGILSTQVPD